MTKDKRYIIYIAVLASLLVFMLLSKNKQHDWTVTFAHEDKNPYGTYALDQLLPNQLNNKKVSRSYKTLYELKDSIRDAQNIFIVSTRFAPDAEDTKVLLKLVESGSTAFISANYFYGTFADTLGITTADSFFQGDEALNREDSAFVHFTNSMFDTTSQYYFRRGNVPNYFQKINSVKATVLARNDFDQPVAIRIARGKGVFVLSSTPMTFTNIYLLAEDNHEFISGLLSYLPSRDLIRTEFYHLGRMEVATPLRYILITEPLRWAYYITIISLLLFMIFEAKRKQRIIPVLKPLGNTTLEFVSTIGNLYYQAGDHKNIAEKKIQFFFDQVHTNYLLSPQHRDEHFISALAKKSGVSESVVKDIVTLINRILTKDSISEEELISLNKLLERFHQST